jgi:sucrose phosphorylase
MKNLVQLITYVDRLAAGSIRDLHSLLTRELKDLFGAVHLLPFYHPIDGADAGFDPVDHTAVDDRLGTWSDIEALARDIDIMADLIVNHVSSESVQFQDYLHKGRACTYAGLFLAYDSVFPQGATETDLIAIFRQRASLPFTVLRLNNGESRAFWTTFTPQQIDIDVEHQQGRVYLAQVMETLARHGVKMIRLDAVGYAIKRAGTSCFMIPETFRFIDALTRQARSLGMEVLVEIHSHYRDQIKISQRVDRVYDFALPPLVLHAFVLRTAKYLKHWIAIRPTNALTVLDTHDGIGIIDIGPDPQDPVNCPGLVPDDQLAALVEIVHERTRGASRLATGAAASNVDQYQINTTFYDAMGADDETYLMARAIQFFLPGVPQVYYVGLLAGSNDVELLTRTRVGRDINRHYHTKAEVVQQLARPVVAAQLELIRLRNTHPAFAGRFELAPSDDDVLQLRWSSGHEFAELLIRFHDRSYELRYSEDGTAKSMRFPDTVP